MPSIYRVPDAALLHWRSWDGEHVLYDDGSGDTHLLVDLGRTLVESLARRRADVDTLVAEVAESRGTDVDGGLTYEVKQALRTLVAAGIVCRVDR